MIFVYRKWEAFCRRLKELDTLSIPAKDVSSNSGKYLVLKHDVETDVKKAFKLAQIESKYGHKGSYYVQAYLLNDTKNINFLKKMNDMGHEISYHHDVMDFCRGNLSEAIKEFEKNKEKFISNGFDVVTVCQHGNPIIERVGYSSNRDFFRRSEVKKIYPTISDVMVNFKDNYQTDYNYYSDSGHKFKYIYDPINNDIVNSDDKNVSYKDLDALLNGGVLETSCIISTHPHRWSSMGFLYVFRVSLFKIIKRIAKSLSKIKFVKKFMSKYYYLAKKI